MSSAAPRSRWRRRARVGVASNSSLENGPKSCRFHPESYSGETAQRWKAPGDVDGGGAVHYFWTCCGSPIVDSSGCCAARHISYDDEDEAKSACDQATSRLEALHGDGRPEPHREARPGPREGTYCGVSSSCCSLVIGPFARHFGCGGAAASREQRRDGLGRVGRPRQRQWVRAEESMPRAVDFGAGRVVECDAERVGERRALLHRERARMSRCSLRHTLKCATNGSRLSSSESSSPPRCRSSTPERSRSAASTQQTDATGESPDSPRCARTDAAARKLAPSRARRRRPTPRAP